MTLRRDISTSFGVGPGENRRGQIKITMMEFLDQFNKQNASTARRSALFFPES